jgi:opacity protein-like surface antigen
MKMLVAVGAALAALMTVPAIAADMPVKAPVVKATLYDWTGFYVGANAGGGWSFHSLSLFPGGDFDAMDGGGSTLGGYVGYNVQVAPWLVLGVEGAGAWAAIRMNQTDCPGLVAECTNRINSLGSARARIGIAFDRVLGYVATGWGFANARYDRIFVAGGPTFEVSPSLNGPSTAGGVEVALTDYLIGRVQYDFYLFNKSFGAGALDPAVRVDVNTKVHSLTVGLAVKFGGPVAAKF